MLPQFKAMLGLLYLQAVRCQADCIMGLLPHSQSSWSLRHFRVYDECIARSLHACIPYHDHSPIRHSTDYRHKMTGQTHGQMCYTPGIGCLRSQGAHAQIALPVHLRCCPSGRCTRTPISPAHPVSRCTWGTSMSGTVLSQEVGSRLYRHICALDGRTLSDRRQKRDFHMPNMLCEAK